MEANSEIKQVLAYFKCDDALNNSYLYYELPSINGRRVRFAKVLFRILTVYNEENIVEFLSSKRLNSDIVLHRLFCFISASPIYRKPTFEINLFSSKRTRISHPFGNQTYSLKLKNHLGLLKPSILFLFISRRSSINPEK